MGRAADPGSAFQVLDTLDSLCPMTLCIPCPPSAPGAETPLRCFPLHHQVEALGGDAALKAVRLAPLPLPTLAKLPSLEELNRQAAREDARRKSSWAGRAWDPMMPAELFGPGRTPWPQAVRGDVVRSFDEISAARGGLGRFTGAGVMPLVKQFAGCVVATRPTAVATAT